MLLFPNTELAVRDWLRARPDVTDLLESTNRVDLEPHTDLPCVVVYRAGGTTDPYLPLDRAILGVDCWGTTRSRMAAMNLSVAVSTALTNLASENLNDDVFGLTALVESVLYAPSPEGRHRYAVTTVVTARSLTALAV